MIVCATVLYTAALSAQAGTITLAKGNKSGPQDSHSVVNVPLSPKGNCFLFEYFDEIVPPELPPGWEAMNGIDPDGIRWVTSDSGDPSPPADSPPNAAFVNDPDGISDKYLYSPSITIGPVESAFLSFRQNYNLEASDVDPNLGFDGGVLEVSVDGGPFQDLGGSASGGYNRTISNDRGSPIAGRQAWSGNSGGFIETDVDVPFQGSTIVLRWRMASDKSISSQGWRIDSVQITCERPTPTPTPLPPTPTPTPRCPPPERCYEVVVVSENFDNVTPPALPSDWLATNAQGAPPLWVTSNSGLPVPAADSLPNAAFVDDPDTVSDKRLDSLLFFFGVISPQITFRQNFKLEASDVDPNLGFDGGVLEISTDGGNTFQDILDAGGSFGAGGYSRTISNDRGSPIAGRQAWSGNSNGFVTTVVNLPEFGNLIRLRWRMASDTSGSSEGWRVDSLYGAGCAPLPCSTPTPTPFPSITPTPTPTITPTPTATLTPTPTQSPTATPRVTPRRRPTPHPRPTPR